MRWMWGLLSSRMKQALFIRLFTLRYWRLIQCLLSARLYIDSPTACPEALSNEFGFGGHRQTVLGIRRPEFGETSLMLAGDREGFGIK